ncbi:hypothetical protein BDY19DRAFT_1050697 [Irpex rosettiformis]|uniref:Uncharacterized protein n=1 Tax=Irpex rosettiformis TaxID=378272 RepID=A0ACB8TU33_9APHY|nr:hypothetical protein BDY19DRAFT_1050697 [Irpex rosettiformis]
MHELTSEIAPQPYLRNDGLETHTRSQQLPRQCLTSKVHQERELPSSSQPEESHNARVPQHPTPNTSLNPSTSITVPTSTLPPPNSDREGGYTVTGNSTRQLMVDAASFPGLVERLIRAILSESENSSSLEGRGFE